mmetsp:Transcript_18839/g.43806  ORF Transcript_18839/g.43806 Transcript_18839/m.43806 type:complete len:1340 (-) Transcript_18839:140-4159(-)
MDLDPQFVKDIEAKAAAGDALCQAAGNCLKAMRAVIVTNGCAGSSTAYFAAAITTLQTHLQSGGKSIDADGTTAALLLILRKSLGAVPPKAVHGHLNDVINSVTVVLKNPEKEDLVKQSLSCLAALADIAFDADSRPNRKVTKPVVGFIADPRPAVRQRAHLTVVSIARRASTANDEQTLSFIGQHLAQIIASAKVDKKMFDNIPARHAVSALKGVATYLPQEQLLSVSEALLKLPGQLGQHPVCIEGFGVLASLLQEATAGRGSSPAALAAALLPHMLALPVTVLNVAYAAAHTQALAALVMASLATSTGAEPLPNMSPQQRTALTRLIALFSERDPSLLRTVREELQRIFAFAGEASSPHGLQLLQAVPDLCRPLMSYERKAVWPQSLPVISAAFDAVGAVRVRVPPAEILAWTASQFAYARQLLQDLLAARDAARGAELNVFGKEMDQCFESAITTYGPEAVLSICSLRVLEVPLTDPSYEQASRSWLLLVLKDSCRRTQLAYFVRYFMSLASNLRARAKETANASPILAKKYTIMLGQVWALLPGFCTEPLDMHAAMLSEGGRFAKQMISVLLNEPDLRGHVWMALKKACETAQSPPSALSEALAKENMACVKQLSQHVLPEMLTAYVKMHSEGKELDQSRVSNEKQLALEAVKCFATISDPQLLTNVFKSVVTKLLKLTAGEEALVASAPAEASPLADLANTLVPLLPADTIELVLKVFTPMLKGGGAVRAETVPALQKAGYRAIQCVLEHPGAIPTTGPGTAKVLEFWTILRDARETCEGSALKARLSTLQTLLDLMQERLASQLRSPAIREGFLDCLKSVLPEVMLHLRDQSTAVREAARDCLHVASTTALHQELESELVTLISAGLASLTPYSKASALDALSRLFYEHSYIMTPQLLDRLVRIVLVLLEDQDAQVYRASLKFCKVVVFVLPREKIGVFLQPMMSMFFNRHLTTSKMLARRIMERFIRVLPMDTLVQHVPKAHQPLLFYLQKQLRRRHRPKSVLQAGDGGEEEEGNNEDAEMEDAGLSKPSQSWADFKAEEENDAEEGEAGEAAPGTRRRRRKGEALAPGEPLASAAVASQSVQALLDAWEAESDDDGEGKKKGAKAKRKREQVEASTWIHEDQDVPLDFMSAQAAQSVLTVRPPQMKRQRADEAGTAQGRAEALRRHGLRFSEDGRLVMDEEAEEAADEDEEGEKKFTLGTASGTGAKPLSKLAAMRAARAKAKAKAKAARKATHMVKGMEGSKPGKKKAQGDVKRAGSKLEPFAYVKLNPRAVKEKFKDKNQEAFAKVVKGAKNGIIKGNKARARELKLRKAKENRRKSRPKKAFKPGSR